MLSVFKIFSRKMLQAYRKPHVRLSFLLIMSLIVISTILLSINVIGTTYEYSIGDIAKNDIRVPSEIIYRIESETEMERKRKSEMVPLVFDRDQSVLMERLKLIETFFGHVSATLSENPPHGKEDRTFQLIALKSRLPQYLMYDDKVLWEALRHENTEELMKLSNRVVIYVYDQGVLEKPYGNPLNIDNKNVSIRTINTSEDTNEISKTLEDLHAIDEVRKDLYQICYSIVPQLPKKQIEAVSGIVRGNLSSNLRFNIEETRRRIEETVKSVKPVMGVLKKGQTLVREGDTVTTESLEKIRILNKYTASTNVKYIFGVFLLQLAFFVMLGYFLVDLFNTLIPDRKASIIIFTLVLFFVLYTFLLSRSEVALNTKVIFALLLPIPFVTMIIAILYNIYMALIIGFYLVFFSFIVTGTSSISSLAVAFSSSIFGIFVISDVERRTDFLRGGFILGLINTVVVIAAGLMEEFTFYNIVKNIGVAMASGIINSIMVLGVFPLYENVFGVTTRFKLLELSDLNAPLFKRMLIKAPGTYNHSLMVANMSEAACKEISANYLLARVGGYYHDIGKIESSGIYIENKITDKRARSLTPREYSRMIIAHVDKGVDLAEKNLLPESIIDFIREHHGRSTMTYFYHQALELADSSGRANDINKSDFQYAGPSPHTKEIAIVMLADAVEAASRSLQEPTYVKLEGLVKKIIYNKLNEGELDHSDITLSDLNRIQKAFLRVLNGMFHTRIEYPEKEELEKLENRVMNREDED